MKCFTKKGAKGFNAYSIPNNLRHVDDDKRPFAVRLSWQTHSEELPLFSVPILRNKSHFSHVFLRYYGGQLKTAVEQKAGDKIGCKK